MQGMEWVERRRGFLTEVRTIYNNPATDLVAIPELTRRPTSATAKVLTHTVDNETLQLRHHAYGEPESPSERYFVLDFPYYDLARYTTDTNGHLSKYGFRIYETTQTLIIESNLGRKEMLTQKSPEASWNALASIIGQLKGDATT